MSDVSRFKVGTSVLTHIIMPAMGGDWLREARVHCGDQLTGEIVSVHDAHGLCYGVKHADGSLAYYDHAELTVLPEGPVGAGKAVLRDKLLKILGNGDKLEVSVVNRINGSGFQLKYGQMYEKPGLTFDTLFRLAELFGTRDIDVDDYAIGGCDTCDYGSNYGHEIQILNPTKWIEELKACVGKNLYVEESK